MIINMPQFTVYTLQMLSSIATFHKHKDIVTEGTLDRILIMIAQHGHVVK